MNKKMRGIEDPSEVSLAEARHQAWIVHANTLPYRKGKVWLSQDGIFCLFRQKVRKDVEGHIRPVLPKNYECENPIMEEWFSSFHSEGIWVTPEERGSVVKEVGRFSGWLQNSMASDGGSRTYPMLFNLLKKGVDQHRSWKSPSQKMDLLAVFRRWPSPGALENYLFHLRRAAAQVAARYHLKNIPEGVIFNMVLHGHRSISKARVQVHWALINGMANEGPTPEWKVYSFRESRKRVEEFFLSEPGWAPEEKIAFRCRLAAPETLDRGSIRAMMTAFVRHIVGMPNLASASAEAIPLVTDDGGTTIRGLIAPHLKEIKKRWGKYQKTHGLGPHDLISLLKLYVALGKKARVLADKGHAHGNLEKLGQNLPWRELREEAEDWYISREARWLEAGDVVTNWDFLTDDKGWRPWTKGSLDSALGILASLQYPGHRNTEFANVAASARVPSSEYGNLERRWMKELENLSLQTVPAPGGVLGVAHGDMRLFQMVKDDPRAVFAGFYTSCCQHPFGEGKECAWHAHHSPNGAIWAIERNGRIIAQSWVWREKDVLVLDNVECGPVQENKEMLVAISEIIEKAADEALNRLGVQHVLVGLGYTKPQFPGHPEKLWNYWVKPPANYSDAHDVKVIGSC